MTERDYGAIARDAAYSFGRLVGRGAKAGHHQLEVFLGGPDRTKVILILAAVLGLSGADAATVGAAATELTKALHISQADIGLLVAVTSLVAAAASVPFGVLADKAPRTRTLGVTIFLWGAVMLWSATASSFGHLLASRAVLGVVTAAAGPIVASLVGDLFGGDERGRIYGYILTGEMVGGGVGFAVTGDVAALSWRAAFVILAIPAFLLAWSVIRLPEPARTGGRGRRPGRSPDGAPPFRPGPWTPPPDDSPPGAARGTYRPSSTGPLPVGPPGGRPTPPGGSPTPPPAGSTPPPRGSPPPVPPAFDAPQPENEAQALARERGLRPEPAPVGGDPARMRIADATRYIFAIRTNVILIIASACGYFFLAGIQTFGVEYVEKQYRVNTLLANPVMIVIGLGAVAGVLTGGTLGDALLRKRYLNARVMSSAVPAAVSVVLFLPAILTRSLVTAVPYLTGAAFFLSVQQAPINAARLDIMPAPLWGRAEGYRSAIRTAAQALAPPVFGFLADVIGRGGNVRGGLEWAFLLMLIPLAAGAVLLFRALSSYPQDVANATGA